jgi:zinc D-Ala-D-Ala carboxypeptidase
MKLSENLSLSEVIKSNTATRKRINNTPTDEHLANLKVVAKVIFQPLRDALGAITVSSGYRSKKLNSAIKGSRTSQHCKGEALDLDNDHKKGRATNREIFFYIKNNLPFDQLIWEFGNDKKPDWVHVSFNTNGKQRGIILRAVPGKYRTNYIPFK